MSDEEDTLDAGTAAVFRSRDDKERKSQNHLICAKKELSHQKQTGYKTGKL